MFFVTHLSTRFSRFVRRKPSMWKRFLHQNYPELNFEYLCDPKNATSISENISRRKGVGNINAVQNLYSQLKIDESVKDQFYSEALRIPNDTHPEVTNYGNEPKIIKYIGTKPTFNFEPFEFHDITKKLKLMRTEQLGNVSGNRSYYFLGDLVKLENALIRYTLHKLMRLGFKLLTVPDILHSSIIESCGMNTKGERTQVYHLDPELHDPNLCLSGTSEMAIAGYFQNKILNVQELPLKIAAVSRCYRAETSSIAEERGIFRVHQFTKVEMFAVTTKHQSSEMLESFRQFEEEHFSSLGLYLQILDMPPHELGAPAFRKYDIEAWLPGRKQFGEISSCSNCTDYQTRRLSIKYQDNDQILFAHTVNGTALAVPRMLIALLETYQRHNGKIEIPEVLRPFMKDQNFISKQKHFPELKLLKIKN